MSGGNGAGAHLSTDELRAAVRSVLRDVLPAAVHAPEGTAEVVLRTDADLDAFVRRVAALCEDAGQRAELQTGRRRFTLAAGDEVRASPAKAPAGSVLRLDRGAVTERTVKQAAADGARLVVGRRAVLTPLARDKARSLGVVIEKES